MNITIFTIWALTRLIEAHYENKMINHDEIYITLPKYACDNALRNLSHCVSGAEFTPEAIEDFEYNAHLYELYSQNVCDKNGYEEEAPQIELRCCTCDIQEDTGCDNTIYDFCRLVFISPGMLYYYSEQVYAKKPEIIFTIEQSPVLDL